MEVVIQPLHLSQNGHYAVRRLSQFCHYAVWRLSQFEHYAVWGLILIAPKVEAIVVLGCLWLLSAGPEVDAFAEAVILHRHFILLGRQVLIGLHADARVVHHVLGVHLNQRCLW